MNQPDRYEKFVVPPHIKKIEMVRDTKIQNAATFVLQREDHTIGNMLRMQLHRDRDVVFSGYRIPHPLEYRMNVKVQTNGNKTADEALANALEDLHSEFTGLREKLAQEFGVPSIDH